MCDACEVHEDGMDYLSRHDLAECNGLVGFTVEDTGMGTTVRGQEIVPMPATRS